MKLALLRPSHRFKLVACMTLEQQNSPKASRPIVLSPWLTGLVALAFYLCTLNHWVTLGSVADVARMNGWDWHPDYLFWRPAYIAPLYTFFTAPLLALPAAWRPVGLNIFSAICAAGVLLLLVRSVRLLPHDRTREQRQRALADAALLPVRESWLPPLLAALVCGLQLTFWEKATAGSVEMFDLLIFAWLIFCLLQFRVSKENRWLGWFVFSYGSGVCNNWALVGFFPFFFAALIWVAGRNLLNLKLLVRLLVVGVAGLLCYLLLPLMGALSGEGTFWSLLHAHLGQQKLLLASVPRVVPLLVSLPSVMAILFIAIRWPSFSGEMSALGDTLSYAFSKVIHIAFLSLGLWFFFDCKLSPRALLPGASFLSFYYLAAIAVGYFIGYLLLVCNYPSMVPWLAPRTMGKAFNRLVIILLWTTLVAVPAGLLWKNLPSMRAANSTALPQFATALAKSLPETTSVVLSDDRNLLLLLQAGFQRLGRSPAHILIETSSLAHRDYLLWLRSRYPEFQKLIAKPELLPPTIDPASMSQIVFNLAGQHPVYYLHPSFGFFFERFYSKPSGLAYQLRPSSTGVLNAPPLSAKEIETNQQFWDQFRRETLPQLAAIAKQSLDPGVVATYYSRGLVAWGVQLQRENRLPQAGVLFSAALQLNPANISATLNQQFNTQLQAGNPLPISPSEETLKAISRYRSWDALLSRNGPVDEPQFNLKLAALMAEGHNAHQATALFQRNLQLRPTDPQARLGLTKCATLLGQPDKAIEMIRDMRNSSGVTNHVELAQLEALAYLQKNEYSKAEQTFLTVCQKNPQDIQALEVLIAFYRSTGYTAQRSGQSELARQRFKTALGHIDPALRLASNSALDKQVALKTAFLLQKAELQMQLGEFTSAIATLDLALENTPRDTVALMNRAIAQLLGKKLEGARRDYLALQKVLPPTTYAIYYGLGEIAYQLNDKPSALKNYRLYLKHAPKMAPEYKRVAERLRTLEGGRS